MTAKKTKAKTIKKSRPRTCRHCGHAMINRVCERCAVKPGDPCPDCGEKLKHGGCIGDDEHAPAAVAHCRRCGSVFGAIRFKLPPWGDRDDAHLEAVENWLKPGRTRAEINEMLTDYIKAARTFGQAPLAWEKGRRILKEELRAHDMRNEGFKNVERRGDQAKSWPDMLTNQEAAEYLECTDRTIRNLLKDELLTGVIGHYRQRRMALARDSAKRLNAATGER